MPKQKAKPLWHDPGIEWFFVSATPQSPAIHGGIENGRRIDHDDSDEIRRCLSTFRQALRTSQKPTRLAKDGLIQTNVPWLEKSYRGIQRFSTCRIVILANADRIQGSEAGTNVPPFRY
jgi:hypothetical protein